MMVEFERKIVVPASVRPVEQDEEFNEILTKLASVQDGEAVEVIANIRREARPSPVIDGKPRMLHITAWMAHEGPNDNGDAFVKEELQAVAGDLFKEAHAGILDFNHDLQPRGYWYAAEFAYDENAQKWGVLAHGAIWAWLFEDVAMEMLATQTREGFVEVSMMVLTNRIELVKQDDRYISVLHDPVFVAVSVLNVKPGDANAQGLVSEDPADSTKEQRMQQLQQRAATLEGDQEMEELLNQIQAALPNMSEEIVTKLTAAMEAQAQQVRDQVAAQEARVAELTAEVEQAQARVAELETIVSERDVTLEGVRAELEAATAQVAEFEAQIAEVRAAEEARAEEERGAARFNELPESVRERIAARPEADQERMRSRWAKMSEEEWNVTKDEMSLGAGDSPRFRLPNLSAGRTQSGGRINLDQHLVN